MRKGIKERKLAQAYHLEAGSLYQTRLIDSPQHIKILIAGCPANLFSCGEILHPLKVCLWPTYASSIQHMPNGTNIMLKIENHMYIFFFDCFCSKFTISFFSGILLTLKCPSTIVISLDKLLHLSGHLSRGCEH